MPRFRGHDAGASKRAALSENCAPSAAPWRRAATSACCWTAGFSFVICTNELPRAGMARSDCGFRRAPRRSASGSCADAAKCRADRPFDLVDRRESARAVVSSESRRRSGVRSSISSATTWMTPEAFCSLPVTQSAARRERSGRNFSNIARPDDRHWRSAVSSSSVAKMTPLAVPGRWRTSTRPPTVTRRPGRHAGQLLVAQDAARVEIGAQERHRMRLQRQMQMPVILDHMLAGQHRRQMRVGLDLRPWSRAQTAADRPCRRRGAARGSPRALRGGRGRASGTHPHPRAAPARRVASPCAARDRGWNRSPRRATLSMRLPSSSENPLICRKPSRSACVGATSSFISA